MKLRNIIYLIVFLLLLNCKKNTFQKKESLTANNPIEKNEPKLNKVVITGTTDDIIAFKHLGLLNNTYLFGRSHLDATKEIFSDSLHMVLNLIEKPLFMEVTATSDKAFYRGHAFMTPGDTISIRIKNRVMKFFGKNAIYNNYYSEMNKQTPEYSRNPYLGSLNRYKKELLINFGELEEYEQLSKAHPELNEQLQGKYNQAREQNSALLGKIKAIENLLNQ